MNRRGTPWTGRIYLACVFCAGSAALVWAVRSLIVSPIGYEWLILAALTWLSGPFAVKISSIAATISVSEAFVFTMILVFGGAPATVTVAVDGLLTSLLRRNREPRRLLFNVTEPALSASVAAAAFFWVVDIPPLSIEPSELSVILLPMLVLTSTFFLTNSWLTTLAVVSETGQPAYQVWRSHSAWLSVNYFVGASIALLLGVNLHGQSLSAIGAAVPLLVGLYITFKTWTGRLDDANQHLKELNALYMATVESLAMAVDAKDQVTHGHIRRVQHYSVELARALGSTSELEVQAIEAAALLHDMGKLAIPDYILNKPGKLTPSEYDKMKQHAVVGADILSAVEFPYPVVPIVRHHHENWDGSGYPDGITGEQIPVGARILSVVDCFDALTSDRPYRRALSTDQAIRTIRQHSGTMYDPTVVETFARVLPRVRLPRGQDEELSPALAYIRDSTTAPPPAAEPSAIEAPTEFGASLINLARLLDTLPSPAELTDALDLVGRRLKTLTPAALVAVYLVDDKEERLIVRHATGHGESFLRDFSIPLGERLSGWVTTSTTSIANSDPRLDFRKDLMPGLPGLASALSVPILADGEALGALTLYAIEPEAFGPADVQLTTLVADQVAWCLKRFGASGEAKQEWPRDPVTGLPTRESLTGSLDGEGLARVPLVQPLGVMAIELMGLISADADEVDQGLVVVLSAVRRAIRIADLVFRGGHRQLVILMPGCDESTGRLVGQRIKRRLAEARNGRSGPTVRLGFACCASEREGLGDLLAKAETRVAYDARPSSEGADEGGDQATAVAGRARG